MNGGGYTFQVDEEESYNIVSDGIFDDVVGNDMDVCDVIGSGDFDVKNTVAGNSMFYEGKEFIDG